MRPLCFVIVIVFVIAAVWLGLKKPLLLLSLTGLYALFLKGQGHQGIFSLVKGTLWGNCKFLLEHFKGTKVLISRSYCTKKKYLKWSCFLPQMAWPICWVGDESKISWRRFEWIQDDEQYFPFRMDMEEYSRLHQLGHSLRRTFRND